MERKANTDNVSILQNVNTLKPVYSLTPFTLLDYPGKTACILWYAGCNMRCSYCYNPEIVLGKGKVDYEQVLRFLDSRKGLLDGVVLSGGECTSHKSIFDLLREIKKRNFLVKIDTNGSNPETIQSLILQGLVDYIALDFKAPEKEFYKVTRSYLFPEFKKTLLHLLSVNFPFEVRTTVHSELLKQSDIEEMTTFLEQYGYKGAYYLQQFRNDADTLGKIGDSDKCFDTKSIVSGIEIILRS